MSLADQLTLGSRWTFVGGKGGVGKTTVAAALAVELAASGEVVTILSTDPAHSLGDAFGTPLSSHPASLPSLPNIRAFEVDAARERAEFLARHGPAIRTIVERGTYLEESDVRELTDLPPPGLDELAALLRLADLAGNGSSRVIIDTAPTGHTLRLLDLPQLSVAWLGALEAMQRKHDAVAAALVGGRLRDDATDFLEDLRRDIENLVALLHEPEATRFVLVTTSEAGVLAETLRYEEELERRKIALGGVVINRHSSPVPDESLGKGVVFVPPFTRPIEGLAGLREFAAAATAAPSVGVQARKDTPTPTGAGSVMIDGPYLPPPTRLLYLIGGKGGVGKTTVAAALALRLARTLEGRVLLLSVDPAGSLGEVLATSVRTVATSVGGFEHLFAQQLDARAVWEEFANRYRSDIESIMTAPAAGSSASLDREVLDRLLDLAPPGLDELMSLVEVVDSLEDGEYDALVLDTAPTGHFVRLLEMPELALEWTHTLLRLLLKYREVMRLEGLGERVLVLARTLRKLRDLLADPTFTWVGVVALPESLSLPETARLIPRLRGMGMTPDALIINRILTPAAEPEIVTGTESMALRLIRIDAAVTVIGAPTMPVGPSGAEPLARFLSAWRMIGEGAAA